MIFSRLRYFTYRLLSKKPFNGKAGYNSNLVAGENLSVLKQRLKQNHKLALHSSNKLATDHLALGDSLLQIIKDYGRPSYVQTHKTGGVTHDVILYKRIIKGLKSRVIYNFINDAVASVTFQISVGTPQQLSNVNQFIANTYLDSEAFPSENQFTVLDNKGNKLDYNYTFDVKLTFINNDPEIIQNINAALYQNRYSHERYVDSTKFQLSM
jgi:hypothetical protein